MSALFVPCSRPAAQSVAEFYTGKTVTISVGYSPGGSYDYYPRVFARYLGKYIPGNPTVVVQNMPGAGSLRAANFLYNVAPKDGTALGVVTQTVMLEAPLGTPGVKYNAVEFTYIGRMTGVLETMISWHEAPAKNIVEARKVEMIAGGTGPTSPTEGYPRLLNAFAGTKFRIVSGFGGTSEIMLAMERREVDALENSWNSIVRTKREWIETKKINVLIQAVMERSKELPEHADTGRDGRDAGGQGGARVLYQRGGGEPLADRHARHSGGPAEGAARRVPGGDARPGVPGRDQEVAVGIRSGAGRISGRPRQEDRGDAAGDRAAHRGGAKGEVDLGLVLRERDSPSRRTGVNALVTRASIVFRKDDGSPRQARP